MEVPKMQHTCLCEGDFPEAIPNFTGDCSLAPGASTGVAAKNAARKDIEFVL